ncbi:sulfur carrier protein ThiS [Paraconexibacter antarcticus]|uniref:Sulfur carrier protein ThiS n=1 Tax=Paraconexibacter antarcticus TaxID=2949664 RepID=A0ABY5DVB8_9ACTN|nr:sulfur carrier protein ThiS [Paraconexibacter antarcticus]UTI64787.1 sulfur carrier protein ThiS [Paraconexibacter antarcticus]
MTLTVNGAERTDIPAGTTVAGLLDLLDLPQRDRGVAVAVDAEVVPKSAWASTVLADGDEVEVLVAVQGG